MVDPAEANTLTVNATPQCMHMNCTKFQESKIRIRLQELLKQSATEELAIPKQENETLFLPRDQEPYIV